MTIMTALPAIRTLGRYPKPGRTNCKVLVVDDDKEHVAFLRLMLEKFGMSVVPANTGLEALKANFNHRPDVILLDLMMPDMDGYTATQRLREISDVPILIVSAKKQTEDITKAFALGADDYVSKPYDNWELVARIRGAVRRTADTSHVDNEIIALGNADLIVDPARRRTLVKQREVKLTKTEFALLLYLARNRGRVLTHAMIQIAVWEDETGTSKDTLRHFVSSLRKKIEQDPRNPRWLVNEPGVGYSLVPD